MAELINPNPIVYDGGSSSKNHRSLMDDLGHITDSDDDYLLIDSEMEGGDADGVTGSWRSRRNSRPKGSIDPIDALEVFDALRNINDPEHPLTLEQLNVTQIDGVVVDNAASTVRVEFTPTIPHCSMATLIGLSLRVKLLRSLPSRFKVDIQVASGTHVSEVAINKQLNDKERVCAALENDHLLSVVNTCLYDSERLPADFDVEDVVALAPRRRRTTGGRHAS